MNLIAALEQLGYENIVDFEVRTDDLELVYVWRSLDDYPFQAVIDQAWVDYQAANPVVPNTYN